MFKKKTRDVELRYVEISTGKEHYYKIPIRTRTKLGARWEMKGRLGYRQNMKKIRIRVL